MAVSHKPVISDDLYTKIALDNKLVTQFYLRKATEEQEKLERAGQKMDMGAVMVKMGILTDRQHQSVLNACLYREQRDYDKRFGRQCLRMAVITQEKIEEALDEQKSQYMKSGAVRPMSDFLVELGAMTTEQVSQVHEGITARDKAKKDVARDAVRSGRNLAGAASSASMPALGAEAKKSPEKAKDAPKKGKPAPTGKRKLRDSGESDVDDAELEDDESNLDDVDLDDDDLDDVDLDEDLDEEDEDEELDAADLDEAERELAKQGSKSSGSRPAPAADDDDEPKLDLGKLEDMDPAHEGAEDEEDLAEEVSEVDSEVDLDEDDLKALEEMESGDQTEEDTSWAADAFDDRPLDKRAPSERLPKSSPPPPPPPPPPSAAPPPSSPPAVPTAAGSARVPRWMTVGKAKKGSEAQAEPATTAAAEAKDLKPGKVEKELLETAPEIDPPPPPAPAKAPAKPAAKPAPGPAAKAGASTGSGDDILGGDVFEGNISEEGRIPPDQKTKARSSGKSEKASERTKAKTSGRNQAAKTSARTEAAKPPEPKVESKPPEPKKTSTRAPAAKSEPELKPSAKTDKSESKAEMPKTESKRGASGRAKAIQPPSTLGDLSDLDGPSAPELGNDSGITLELGDLTDQLDEELPKPKGKLPAGLDEAKLRRAFDRAVEGAWKSFLEELKRM